DYHWTAQSSSVLVLSKGSLLLKKSISGIEGVVAQIFPKAAAQFVSAGLSHHINDPTQGTAKLGLVIVRLHFEFLNRIDDWRNSIRAEERSLIVDTVQHEEITAIGLTIY